MSAGAPSTVVAAFDLDGVLVDSEKFKISAWRSTVAKVLHPPTALLDELDLYNRANRGVSRADKFRYALAAAAAERRLVDDLLERYATELERGLSEARPCPGAVEFVDRWPGPVAVVSSAPVDEVDRQVTRLGFRRFDVQHGGDVGKAAALRSVRVELAPGVVFFGDAPADLAAAQQAGTHFVAIGPNRSTFDGAAIASVGALGELLQRTAELVDAALRNPPDAGTPAS